MFARIAAIALLTALPAWAQPVTVAALGDSLTQGHGLPQDAGLVPQLQAWLRDRGAQVTLVNAGVSGDTSAGGLARVDWTLTPEVDGLIVALGGNDLLRGIDPGVTRANLAGILDAARKADVPAMLIGIGAPANYGADYQAAFNGVYPDLARTYGVPLVPSMLAPIAAARDPLSLMQPDGIHPNAQGVRAVVDHIGPQVLEFVEALGACERGCKMAGRR